MKFNRNCKVCGTQFVAIKNTQYFCRRKCFKRDYYLRKKAEQEYDTAHPKRSVYNCEFCKWAVEVPFDIAKNPEQWETFTCPVCGVPQRVQWNEYRTEVPPLVMIAASFTETVIEHVSATFQGNVRTGIYG